MRPGSLGELAGACSVLSNIHRFPMPVGSPQESQASKQGSLVRLVPAECHEQFHGIARVTRSKDGPSPTLTYITVVDSLFGETLECVCFQHFSPFVRVVARRIAHGSRE